MSENNPGYHELSIGDNKNLHILSDDPLEFNSGRRDLTTQPVKLWIEAKDNEYNPGFGDLIAGMHQARASGATQYEVSKGNYHLRVSWPKKVEEGDSSD